MGDRIEQAEAKAATPTPKADGESSVGKFVSNLWGRAEKAGASALETTKEVGGNLLEKGKELKTTVGKELENVDTEKLKRDGKDAAKTGIDVYQGEKSTGNGTVDTVIDFAKELNPFKRTTDKALEIGEKGLDGKPITQEDLKDAAGAAARNFVPIPGADTLRKVEKVKELSDRTGLSDKVTGIVNSQASGDNSAGTNNVVTTGRADATNGVPEVDIVDKAKSGVNKATGAISGFFKRNFGSDGDKKAKK